MGGISAILKVELQPSPITTMNDNTHTPSATEKLESSQAHAKKALDVTAAAAREVAEAAKSSARAAYSTGREELGAAAHDLKHAARSTYEDLSQQARERYNDAAERTSEAAAEYKAQFDEIADQAEDYVRDNPFKAVGITFAVGLVVGLLLRRR